MIASPTSDVLFEIVRPHVALVTLNRPESRNAVNGAVAGALDSLVTEIEADRQIRAVILNGTGGRAFSAGADLKEVSAGRIDSLWTVRGGFAGFVNAPRKKLWIASVEGFALAGGFELVLACDLAVASRSAQFGLPEVSRGLVAAAGGVYRAPRALPKAVAIELVATGQPLDAERAYGLGLVNRLAPKGEALDAALDLALTVALNAPVAVQESVSIARRAFDLSDAELARLSGEAQDRIRLTEDFQEGPRAFVEKRLPIWTGC